MKKILLGSVATGALVAAGSASAADLGPRPAYKAPPMVAPVPIFSWTGCFVGAHGGYGWGKKDVTATGVSGTGGSDKYNQDLSLRRAHSVAHYFEGKKVDPVRMALSGKGESEPVANNSSESGRQQNRRVEIYVEPVRAS